MPRRLAHDNERTAMQSDRACTVPSPFLTMLISSFRSFTPPPVFFLRNHLCQNLGVLVSSFTRYLLCDMVSDWTRQQMVGR